jgi:glycosyltransferase involved in cell wall biosynthesis
MVNVYYWCPFIGNVATIKAVVNSAHSLIKYGNKKIFPTIINSCGEWDVYISNLYEKKIYLRNFKNLFKIDTKTTGYVKSRLVYFMIFISCFFLLKKTLKKDQPTYLIAHLITSLPLFLYLIFNFKTKLIIRVSGRVKMNFFRKMLWKFSIKNIFLITCPTKETQQELIKLKLIENSKIIYLPDPIIDINVITEQKKNKEDFNFKNSFFVTIGRYTEQKNHLLLIKCFKKIVEVNKDVNLLIIGNGELKKNYIIEIQKLGLQDKIKLINFTTNVPFYLYKSIGLISPSLWEDPGFVMIEAAACNTFVISSDCPNGPKEFLGNDSGILFKNNDIKSLEESILKYLKMNSQEILKKKICAKKKTKYFTKFRHFEILSKHLI